MEILTGILCFFNIFKILLDIKEKLITDNDKIRASQFLYDIGMLLKDVASELEEGRYPHEKCAVMSEYLNNLVTVLKSKLDKDEIKRLEDLIDKSYRIEQLLGQLNQLSKEDREINISFLKEAAGNFLGLGNVLKLK